MFKIRKRKQRRPITTLDDVHFEFNYDCRPYHSVTSAKADEILKCNWKMTCAVIPDVHQRGLLFFAYWFYIWGRCYLCW